ncbi:MAG TPA: hypothetical protein VG142_04575 [Trebonia sp.]|jgi:hypothetical protein|nr:hypothetical protein [Trebonia sp.]
MRSWVGRFVRGRRLDRNPLRRASDRLETTMLVVLVIAFSVGVPFVAGVCGAWTHAVAERIQADERATRHEVPAVALQAAQGPVAEGEPLPQVQARWTAPDGKRVTGQVSVAAGTAAGATVQVWVTRDGQIADPPLLNSQVSGQVALAEVGGGTVYGVVLLLTGLFARRSIDGRRMRAWDADWRTSGPSWTMRA